MVLVYPTGYLHCDCLLRPKPFPSSDLPMGVRGVTHYRVNSELCERVSILPCVHVTWGIEGSGIMVIENREYMMHPGEVTVSLPNMPVKPVCPSGEWEYRHFAVDGPLATSIVTVFGFTPGIQEVGPCPADLFDELQLRIMDVSHEGEVQASVLAYRILARAACLLRRTRKGDDRMQQAVDIMNREWNDPQLTISAIARRVGMNRAAFSRKFRSVTGLSPVAFLQKVRLDSAAILLKQTELPVGEIAFRCGYEDSLYFSRLLRKRYGVSPRQFRAAQ